MKVCLDGRLSGPFGIGTFLKHVVKALKGHCDLHVIVAKSKIYSLREQLELPFKIPPCDVFFSPHFNVPLLPIRAKKRVTCVHDVYHLTASSGFLRKMGATVLYNGAFFLSDHVMTVSEFSKNEIMKHATLPPKKISVVYNALSEEAHLQRNPQGFILAVGTKKPHKNLWRLEEAAKRVKMPLCIAGQPAVSEEELKSLYAKAALLVFPSLYEGFGFPPLEAMRAGCPVAVSNVASLPEVCRDGAEYFDPYSIESITLAIERALDRKEELVAKGFDVVKRYSFATFQQKLLEIMHA